VPEADSFALERVAEEFAALATALGEPLGRRLREVAQVYNAMAEACTRQGMTFAEAVERLGQQLPALRGARSLLPDGWADSEGCWADVWYERHHEYLSCDEPPDPASELGLCRAHEAQMRKLRDGR
jgi:hypothetical protein